MLLTEKECRQDFGSTMTEIVELDLLIDIDVNDENDDSNDNSSNINLIQVQDWAFEAKLGCTV